MAEPRPNPVQKSEITVKISPSILIYAAAFVAGFFLLLKIKSIIFVLLIAYIISVGLNKAINKLQAKYRMRRGMAAALVYLLFILVIGSFLSFVVPPLVNESAVLFSGLNSSFDQEHLFGYELNFDGLSKVLSTFGSSISTAFSVISSTFSGVFVAITTLIISLYITLDRPHFSDRLASLTKNKKHLRILGDFMMEVDDQLGNWIRGEVILMTIIGILTFIAALVVGVPYALPLAIFAGLMEVVPNVGPLATAIVAALVAWVSLGWPSAVVMIVACIVIQQLENNLIVPRIMKSNVGLNPLTSIISILLGANLFGILGALLAIPVVIVARSFYFAWNKNN
jgi:predicted PurR-regulated permease PerM